VQLPWQWCSKLCCITYKLVGSLFVDIFENGLTGRDQEMLTGLRVCSASKGGSLERNLFLPEPWFFLFFFPAIKMNAAHTAFHLLSLPTPAHTFAPPQPP
jgi:hypothetical protein